MMMNSVSILDPASIRALEKRIRSAVHPGRFRSNMVIDGLLPFAELDAVGSVLSVGEVQVRVLSRAKRYAATEMNPESANALQLAIRRSGTRNQSPVRPNVNTCANRLLCALGPKGSVADNADILCLTKYAEFEALSPKGMRLEIHRKLGVEISKASSKPHSVANYGRMHRRSSPL